jgi:hypothetical protein
MAKQKPPLNQLRDVDRAIIQAVMFQMGIIPMEKTEFDMTRVLRQLDPAEARTLKRKFRKLWRQAMRTGVDRGTRSSQKTKTLAATSRYGIGKRVPTRAQRNARKQLVFNQLWQDVISPLIQNFENAGGASMPKGKSDTA